jgi:large-conductance mechanosensitive channel
LEVYSLENKRMVQEIIVFIILAATIVYTAVTVVKKLTIRHSNKCDGCSGCHLKK